MVGCEVCRLWITNISGRQSGRSKRASTRCGGFTGRTPERRGPLSFIEIETKDTGERQTMFGRTARHVIIEERWDGNESRSDGWYIDAESLPPETAWWRRCCTRSKRRAAAAESEPEGTGRNRLGALGKNNFDPHQAGWSAGDHQTILRCKNCLKASWTTRYSSLHHDFNASSASAAIMHLHGMNRCD